MSDIIITPIIGNLGSNPCYLSEQDRYRSFMQATTFKLPLGQTSGVIMTQTEPSVEDRDKIWWKVGADGGLELPVPLKYSTTYGRWVGRHPKQIELGFNLEVWVGTTDQLKTYDGGSDAAVTPTTGPMWQISTQLDDLIPIGIKTGGVVETPLTQIGKFATGSADPKLVGVYWIKRTARIYYVV